MQKQPEEQQPPKDSESSLPKTAQAKRSIFKEILAKSLKYKIATFVSALAYWLLYAYSSGMFQYYYSFDITPYLKEDGPPNPKFFSPSNLAGLYYSGVIWYPTSHLELIFFLGQTFFSILLSVLFSLSIILLIYSFRFKGFGKKQQDFTGFFGMIPAIFSGGCCAVPVATLILGSIIPSSVLIKLEFGNPLLLNLSIVILMLSSIYYTERKIINARSCERSK